MMESYQYYYGSDAENFNFFRIPKKLIRDRQFRKLSSDAKILYGLLLDRMALSRKNGWLDEEGRIYIIYTIQDIADEMFCSPRKAIQLLNELDTRSGIGLVERIRRGMGKPNIIYVKNFNSKDEDKMLGESVSHQEVQERACQEVQERAHQEVQECAHQEVQKSAPQNDTDMNDTEYIYNNLSIHQSDYTVDGWTDRNLVVHLLKNKLGYLRLVHDRPEDEKKIGEIIELLADVCTQTGDTVLINGGSVPIGDARKRFMSLTAAHICYVLDRLAQTTGKVRNIKNYLLTCLYNAPATITLYYEALVQHDLSVSGSKVT